MGRTRWPLAEPTVRLQTKGEAELVSLKGKVYRKQHPKAVRASWISKETCHMADRRTALHREGQERTREVCKARHDFQPTLQEGRRKRSQEERSNIEVLIEAVRVKEVW